MRAAAARDIPALAQRRAHLATFERIVREHARAIAQTVAADFGQRSVPETELLEIFPTLEAARYARRHLATWMKPEAVAIAPYFWPLARASSAVRSAWWESSRLGITRCCWRSVRSPVRWRRATAHRRRGNRPGVRGAAVRPSALGRFSPPARIARSISHRLRQRAAHPLALYYFGANSADIARVLEETTSGGACINDVMLQFPQDGLPFGASAPAGWARTTGAPDSKCFPHRKACFQQAKFEAATRCSSRRTGGVSKRSWLLQR